MEGNSSAPNPGQADKNSPVSPTRIALFTVMDFSIPAAVTSVIDKRKDVELVVVVTCSGPKSRRSDAYIEVVEALWKAGHYNTDVIISNKRSKFSEIMQMYKVDMILSIGYPWLLPENILVPSENHPGCPRLGAVNFHNSPLPKYKGPNSLGWSICNGDAEFGFTSHRMSGSFDDGPILHTWTVPDDNINAPIQDLMKKFTAAFPVAVNLSIDKMLAGDPGRPYDGEESFAPKFADEFRWIDFSEATALEVHNKVRAFYGIRDIPKGALAVVEGKSICITRTWYSDESLEDSSNSKPGCVVASSDSSVEDPASKLPQSFFVKCKDAALKVLEWEDHNSSKGGS